MKHKYFYNYSLSAAVFLRQKALCLTLCNWFSGLRLELLEGHNSELLGLQVLLPPFRPSLSQRPRQRHIHSSILKVCEHGRRESWRKGIITHLNQCSLVLPLPRKTAMFPGTQLILGKQLNVCRVGCSDETSEQEAVEVISGVKTKTPLRKVYNFFP